VVGVVDPPVRFFRAALQLGPRWAVVHGPSVSAAS
jgi:hypothetical protein